MAAMKIALMKIDVMKSDIIKIVLMKIAKAKESLYLAAWACVDQLRCSMKGSN